MWLLIVLGAWLTVGLVVALILGRAASRADREELGSSLVWDLRELEHETHGLL